MHLLNGFKKNDCNAIANLYVMGSFFFDVNYMHSSRASDASLKTYICSTTRKKLNENER